MPKPVLRRAYYPGKAPEEVAPPKPASPDVKAGIDKRDVGEVGGRKRRKRVEAQVIVPEGEVDDVEGQRNDDVLVEKILEKEEDLGLSSEEEEEEEEEEEDSSDEEVEEPIEMLKPVFIPRSERNGGKSRRELEEEHERKMSEFEESRRMERVGETQNIVKVIAKKEEEAEKMKDDFGLGGLEMPDDEDREEDEEKEFELWKLREWKRVLRDRKIERKQQGLDVDDELVGEAGGDGENGEGGMQYMQKFYHRGAFFMERDEKGELKEAVYRRNFNEPTQEDKVNKLKLPAVMRARRGQIGKSGRSKHTTIRDEDTAYERTAELRKDRILRDAVAQLHSKGRRP